MTATAPADLIVLGAGAFGASAALELARRGHRVRLVERGPPPHPRASSTDISKVIRPDYAADAFYTDAVLAALPAWRALRGPGGRPLFHETGLLVLSRQPMAPGGFEHDSFEALRARGLPLRRLSGAELAREHPAWAAAGFAEGYLNPAAGWAESAAAVAETARQARALGVRLLDDLDVIGVEDDGALALSGGARLRADAVVVCAGAWTPALLPELAPRLHAVAQPVFHLAPARPEGWRAPAFPTFTADITRTGWYGFPANADGLVKVARHGHGLPRPPDTPGPPSDEETAALRAFLAEALPGLADAPVVQTRRCLYCDSIDGDPILDRHPERPGLIVAAGGSGHAFKLMPALGAWIADVVEGGEPPPRLRWARPARRAVEAARLR